MNEEFEDGIQDSAFFESSGEAYREDVVPRSRGITPQPSTGLAAPKIQQAPAGQTISFGELRSRLLGGGQESAPAAPAAPSEPAAGTITLGELRSRLLPGYQAQPAEEPKPPKEPGLDISGGLAKGFKGLKVTWDYLANRLEKAVTGKETDTKDILAKSAEEYGKLQSDPRLAELIRLGDEAPNTAAAVGDMLWYAIKNPTLVANFLAEQVPGAVVGGGVGSVVTAPARAAAVGAATRLGASQAVTGFVGKGVTGAGINTGAVTLQSLGSNYVEGLQKYDGDTEAASQYAVTKTAAEVPANAVAGAFLGFAPFASKFANIGTQVAIQGAGGATGAFQAAEAVGEKASRGEMILEFLGEGAFAPVDILLSRFGDKKKSEGDNINDIRNRMNVPEGRKEIWDTLNTDPKIAQIIKDVGLESPADPNFDEVVAKVVDIARVKEAVEQISPKTPEEIREERKARQEEVAAAFRDTASTGVGVGVGTPVEGVIRRESVQVDEQGRQLVPIGEKPDQVLIPNEQGVSTPAVSGEDIFAAQQGFKPLGGVTIGTTPWANRFLNVTQAQSNMNLLQFGNELEAKLEAHRTKGGVFDKEALSAARTKLNDLRVRFGLERITKWKQPIQPIFPNLMDQEVQIREGKRSKEAGGGNFFFLEARPLPEGAVKPERVPVKGAPKPEGGTPTPTPAPAPVPGVPGVPEGGSGQPPTPTPPPAPGGMKDNYVSGEAVGVPVTFTLNGKPVTVQATAIVGQKGYEALYQKPGAILGLEMTGEGVPGGRMKLPEGVAFEGALTPESLSAFAQQKATEALSGTKKKGSKSTKKEVKSVGYGDAVGEPMTFTIDGNPVTVRAFADFSPETYFEIYKQPGAILTLELEGDSLPKDRRNGASGLMFKGELTPESLSAFAEKFAKEKVRQLKKGAKGEQAKAKSKAKEASNAAQEGKQQQGDQRKREGDAAGREEGGRKDRKREAKKPQARTEDSGSGGAQESGQGSLDLRRVFVDEFETVEELNKKAQSLLDPAKGEVFRAVRVPIGDLVGKIPGLGLIQKSASLFGKEVVFFKVEEGKNIFDGAVIRGGKTIFVNVTSTKPHIRIVGHELVHALRRSNPAAYERLVNSLQPMLDQRGFAGYTKLLKSEGMKTADKILEEAIGDIVGDRFGESEFWQMLADRNPTGFKQFAREVINFIDNILKKIGVNTLGSETLVKDLKAARTEIARILADVGQETQAAGEGIDLSRSRDNRDSTSLMSSSKEDARMALGLDAKKNVVRRIAEALNQRTIDAGLAIDRKNYSDAAVEALGESLFNEVAFHLQTDKSENGTGLGWYSYNYPRALDLLSERFPELKKNAAARNLFTALVAITSNGEKVTVNVANAIRLYEAYRNGGRFEDAEIGVKRKQALKANMTELETLIERHGLDGLREHLLKEITVAEMNATLRSMGEKSDGSYKADTIVPTAAIHFGPKLGAFYANLSGSEGYLTMDMWWTRTMNRLRGLLIPKATPQSIARLKELVGDPKLSRDELLDIAVDAAQRYEDHGYWTALEWATGSKEPGKKGPKLVWMEQAKKAAGPAFDAMLQEHEIEKASNTIYKREFLALQEAPFNASDREFMYKVANYAQDKLKKEGKDLSIADIQAAIWYYEKRLYEKLSGRTADDIGYEEALAGQAAGYRPERPSIRFSGKTDGRKGPEGGVQTEVRTGREDSGGAREKQARAVTQQTPPEGGVSVSDISLSRAREAREIAPIAGQENSGTTQVATTAGSYKKAARAILDAAPDAANVLDYGAGLGIGTDALREVFGDRVTVESYEPFPQRWAGDRPVDYTRSNEIPGKYDAVVNLNVLNVLEPGLRDQVARDIADKLAPGGVAVIGTRKWTGDISTAKNVEKAAEDKAVYVVRRAGGEDVRVYQKGFDGRELVDYLSGLLGDGFTVSQGSGIAANTAIIQRQSADTDISLSRVRETLQTQPSVEETGGTESAAFGKWFGDSKITDGDGNPDVWYHGTAQDIVAFIPKQAGATFVTKATPFAEGFTSDSENFMRKEMWKAATPEQRLAWIREAIPVAYKNGNLSKVWRERTLEQLKEAEANGNSYENINTVPSSVETELLEILGNQLPSRANIIPVYVRAENPFDYENFKHRSSIRRLLAAEFEKAGELGQSQLASLDQIDNNIAKGDWNVIESSDVQNAIRQAGFDSFYVKEGGNKNLAVYNPNQLKSVFNQGTWSTDNDEISLSRARTSIANAVSTASVPGGFAQAVRDRIASAILPNGEQRFNWWHKSIGTQLEKARTNPYFRRVYDLGQKFLDDTAMFAMRAQAAAPTILPNLGNMTLQFWKGGINKADNELLGKMLAEGTLLNGPSPMNGRVWTDAELRSRYGATDQQIKLYREARGAIDQSLDDTTKALMAQLARSGGVPHSVIDPLMEAQLPLSAVRDRLVSALGALPPANKTRSAITGIKKMATETESLKKAGYSPLMRFGEFVVSVENKDGDVEYFSLHETAADALRTRNEVLKQFKGPGFKVSNPGARLNSARFKMFAGLSPSTLEAFFNAVPVTSKAEENLRQEYLQLVVSNRSALARMIQRKGTAGYTLDATRTLASFITSNSRHASKALNMAEMSRAITEIPAEQGDVANEAVKLQEYVQNPQEGVPGIRGFLFFNFLGGSIAAGLVNMTQPVMMTYPYLSQWGAARAGNAMRKALKDSSAHLLKKSTGDKELDAALKRAAERGITQPQEMFQLIAAAESGTSSLLGHKFMRVWGLNFAVTEVFNRTVSFTSAFNLGRTLPKAELEKAGVKDAFEFAVRSVEDTQGKYNKGNRPNWARETGVLGAAGTLMFTFKQYSIAYLEFLKQLYKNNSNGKRALGIALGTLILAAGISGLPGADDLDDIIDTAGNWMGYPTNSKKWKTKFLTETLGLSTNAANFLLYGVSYFLPMDLQARLGLANLVPGTGLLNPTKDNKAREVLDVLGPIGGFAANTADAIEMAAKGNLRGAGLKMAPKAVKDLYMGFEMATTGELRDEKGRLVQKVDATEALVRASGFNPQDVASEARVERMIQADIDIVKKKKEELHEKLARAIVDKDPKLKQEVFEDLRKWNSGDREYRFQINMAAVQQRVKKMIIDRSQRFAQQAPKDMRARIIRELREQKDSRD